MLRPTENAVVPLPRSGRRLAVAAAVVVLAMLAWSVATNPRFGWDTVARYLFAPDILHGLWLTLQITICAMAIGIAGGVVLALMRLSASGFLRALSFGYIWFFRGTPVLVQLLFWFNIQALYPNIGLPFGPGLDVNALITPLVAAIFGLGLNEAAYMAEITRAGITSIDSGQAEAAKALGMTRAETLRRIVLPQAMRVIIPPTANETISLLKTSSIASVIAVTELLYSAQLIYSVNYLTVPLLVVASLWYLAVTTVLSIGQHYLERRFSRGALHVANRP
ncbi:MAG TPA: amino acid ABC transporter permease [Lichenihabitans sp.]|jgi:polar amino acid transport system permease protein|nr:amino acid ABC transporter permease [Lichenihabitans sp.]